MEGLTRTQLAIFCGSAAEDRIYVSIKGQIFDVSASKHLYGPEGPYQMFAGKEIARSLALFSLDEEHIGSDNIDDLTKDEIDFLEEWIKKFEKRYQKVAVLKNAFSQWTKFLPIVSVAISAIGIGAMIIKSR